MNEFAVTKTCDIHQKVKTKQSDDERPACEPVILNPSECVAGGVLDKSPNTQSATSQSIRPPRPSSSANFDRKDLALIGRSPREIKSDNAAKVADRARGGAR
jgi:hypothetical protein